MQIKKHRHSFVHQESHSNSPLHTDRSDPSQSLSPIKLHRKVVRGVSDKKLAASPLNNALKSKNSSNNLPLWGEKSESKSPIRKNSSNAPLLQKDKNPSSRNIVPIQQSKSFKKSPQKLVLSTKPKLNFKLNACQTIDITKNQKAKLKPLGKLQRFATETVVTERNSRKLFK